MIRQWHFSLTGRNGNGAKTLLDDYNYFVLSLFSIIVRPRGIDISKPYSLENFIMSVSTCKIIIKFLSNIHLVFRSGLPRYHPKEGDISSVLYSPRTGTIGLALFLNFYLVTDQPPLVAARAQTQHHSSDNLNTTGNVWCATCVDPGMDYFDGLQNHTVSPVSAAAAAGDLEALTALLASGRPCDCQDNRGWMPLHHAVRGGNPECVRILLAQGRKRVLL